MREYRVGLKKAKLISLVIGIITFACGVIFYVKCRGLASLYFFYFLQGFLPNDFQRTNTWCISLSKNVGISYWFWASFPSFIGTVSLTMLTYPLFVKNKVLNYELIVVSVMLCLEIMHKISIKHIYPSGPMYIFDWLDMTAIIIGGLVSYIAIKIIEEYI